MTQWIDVDGNAQSNDITLSGSASMKDITVKGDIEMNGGGAKLPIDYDDDRQLINRPMINDVEVRGNKSLEEYGVNTLTNLEIKTLFDKIFGGE